MGELRPNDQPVSPATAGLILAGGMGRRFGGPKAFAVLPDGRTFLEACSGTLSEGGVEPVAATLPPGIPASVPSSVIAVPLPKPDLDMFASIRTGTRVLLESPGWSRLILLPVDHPLVRPGTVIELARADADAAIPALKGRHGHPIMISRRIAEAIDDGSLAGPTMREVLRAASAIDVEVDDPGVRANCNTPEALLDAWEKTR